ncbi:MULTISPECIES: 2-oxo-3-hexenedioate decarboxylase [Cupriavidus]|uniref:2-oxo-3-hexenedioate decarboxylase n=1 Tax=Cupriavidus oxalaticus TaxID=96344 RepID=A0A4P7LEZ9_9BURK|nr:MULTISPECIES: 2-oxo-3-hexenedioate decarboxylase [Cupriavidus]MBF6988253.1 2-oxo-3-hexenedioate decarboxylase [Cupriavidus sp. IK-TO18]QBY51037.1 2-oxo-3-hexenedioate decarboxylase [Cupriavidus oxalaticus]TDF65094.1 2-oxo-3-hexenedioate decarboxylase [Cupriavidus sp. L7L]
MNLTQDTIARLAEHLENAELHREAVPKITDAHPEMDWDDAYAIQDAIRARKLARGTRIAGLKMGLTSFAKMRQMGVSDPVYGFLTDYGACMDGAAIDTSSLIHPKVEAEIAFVLKAPLKGPGCHIGDVLAATDFVVPAVEVIDSRYENFRFDLKSVIADNTSSARFVVGGSHRGADGLDLKTLGVVLEKNGEVVATAAGAAVLGHPANSVAMLANMLGARGRELPAGTFIMTGGVTEAIAVAAGDSITVRYQHLGTVSMRFT